MLLYAIVYNINSLQTIEIHLFHFCISICPDWKIRNLYIK